MLNATGFEVHCISYTRLLDRIIKEDNQEVLRGEPKKLGEQCPNNKQAPL